MVCFKEGAAHDQSIDLSHKLDPGPLRAGIVLRPQRGPESVSAGGPGKACEAPGQLPIVLV